MTQSIRIPQNIITFGLPLLVMFFMVYLSQSIWFRQQPEALSVGIILDLTLTVPLLYFLLIRKRKISNTTVVPFFIGGIVLAGYIIPVDHQFLLSQIKTYVFPLVEMTALFFVGRNVYKLRKSYKTQNQAAPDFYTAFRQATREVILGAAATFLVTEVATIYYGFLHWRKRRLAEHEFSYHKNSGTVAILAVLIFLVLIETFVIHLLLQLWSPLAAWILTGVSLYSLVQIFGILRSLSKRPISIENEQLELRYGILGEVSIPLANIDSVELSTKSIQQDKQIRKLSPLGDLESHNILIHLKNEGSLKGFYGMEKTFTTIALYVDDKQRFKECCNNALGACKP